MTSLCRTTLLMLRGYNGSCPNWGYTYKTDFSKSYYPSSKGKTLALIWFNQPNQDVCEVTSGSL